MTIFTLSILKPPDTRSPSLKSVDLIAREILLSENYNENYFLQKVQNNPSSTLRETTLKSLDSWPLSLKDV